MNMVLYISQFGCTTATAKEDTVHI